MFATAAIGVGEEVLAWGGVYVSEREAREAQQDGKLVMQWDDELFSVEDRGEDDGYYINHSCDPNVWMQGAYNLVARRNIEPNEEITADYAQWEADPDFVSAWICNCGSARCRRRVTGQDWNLEDLQLAYRGHFSPLINKRIRALDY